MKELDALQRLTIGGASEKAVSADAVDDIPIEKPSKGKQDAEEGEGGGD